MYSSWGSEDYDNGPPRGYRPRGRGRGRGQSRGRGRGGRREFTNQQYQNMPMSGWPPMPMEPMTAPMQDSKKYAKHLEKVVEAGKKIEQEQEKAAKEIFERKLKEKMTVLSTLYAKHKPLIDVIRRILTSDKPSIELSSTHCELYLNKESTSLYTVCDLTIRVINPGVYQDEIYGGTFAHKQPLTIDQRIMDRIMRGHEIVSWPSLFKKYLGERLEKDSNYSVDNDAKFNMRTVLGNKISLEIANPGINTGMQLRKPGASYNYPAWEVASGHTTKDPDTTITAASTDKNKLDYTTGDYILAKGIVHSFVITRALSPGKGTSDAFRINGYTTDGYELAKLRIPEGIDDDDMFDIAAAFLREGAHLILTVKLGASAKALAASGKPYGGKVYAGLEEFQKETPITAPD